MIDDIPWSDQRSFPSVSYDRTFPVPAVTISVRSGVTQTKGVDQLLFSSRSLFQISAPVAALRATISEASWLSSTR